MKDQIRICAADLRSRGIEVTSSWLEEPDRPTIQLPEQALEKKKEYAVQDVLDVSKADVLVLFADQTKSIIRAGRHVEFGIAVACQMPILVVGKEYENIFHFLPNVSHYLCWFDVLFQLCNVDIRNVYVYKIRA